MSGLSQYLAGKPFWAWAVTTTEVDAELAKAMALYRQRFGCRPAVVICPEELQVKPVKGLQIEQHPQVPAKTFYFAPAAAPHSKEVMPIN